MKRKWWLVGVLVLFELLVCAGILLTFWWWRDSAGDALAGVRLFYIADTHVEETVEETFAVDGPAVLDLNGEIGDVSVTGYAADEVQVIARLSLWGEDEQDARRQVQPQQGQARQEAPRTRGGKAQRGGTEGQGSGRGRGGTQARARARSPGRRARRRAAGFRVAALPARELVLLGEIGAVDVDRNVDHPGQVAYFAHDAFHSVDSYRADDLLRYRELE